MMMIDTGTGFLCDSHKKYFFFKSVADFCKNHIISLFSRQFWYFVIFPNYFKYFWAFFGFLESIIRSDHVNGRRFEGKFTGKNEFAVIESALVRRLVGSGDDIVPFEDVRREGLRDDVRYRIFFDSHVVLAESRRGAVCSSTHGVWFARITMRSRISTHSQDVLCVSSASSYLPFSARPV